MMLNLYIKAVGDPESCTKFANTCVLNANWVRVDPDLLIPQCGPKAQNLVKRTKAISTGMVHEVGLSGTGPHLPT